MKKELVFQAILPRVLLGSMFFVASILLVSAGDDRRASPSRVLLPGAHMHKILKGDSVTTHGVSDKSDQTHCGLTRYRAFTNINECREVWQWRTCWD